MSSENAGWSGVAGRYAALADAPVDAAWMAEWSAVHNHVAEHYARLDVATTVDTTDTRAKSALDHFLEQEFEPWQAADEAAKKRFLESGYSEPGLETARQNCAADAAVFLVENLELQSAEKKLCNTYDEIVGAQSVEWKGETRTLAQMGILQQSADRAEREAAWRASMERRLQDRPALNELWTRFLDNRMRQAENLGRDFRSVVWTRTHRFDYSPEDCREFAAAIEAEVVPAAARVLERRRAELGLEDLRPWDLECPLPGERRLTPFQTGSELAEGGARIFAALDPELGAQYATMQRERLMDLENRQGKAPGGYCTSFPVQRRPFIFMNAVGLHDDVQTLLHEAGHCFHVFQTAHLPYHVMEEPPTEFCEVASMAMELLAAPYLDQARGGFYDARDAAQARREHLEGMLLFWPYMAVVDQFQHWVYQNAQSARDAQACDAVWFALWQRFMTVTDWSGLEEIAETGWHRKLHIYQIPFYYVEYGLAQLGSVQVYANSRRDPERALAQYKQALALGSTVSLPQLFSAAGAKFDPSPATLREAVQTVESALQDLTPA